MPNSMSRLTLRRAGSGRGRCRRWPRSPRLPCSSPRGSGSSGACTRRRRCARNSTRRRSSRRCRSSRCPTRRTGTRCAIGRSSQPGSSTPRRPDPHRQQGARRARRLSRRHAARRSPTAAPCSSIAAGSPQGASRAMLPQVPPPSRHRSRSAGASRCRRRYLRACTRTRARARCGRTSILRASRRRPACRVLPVIVEQTARPERRGGRRARPRLAGAGFRHRQAPDLHGAVVFVRGARDACCGSSLNLRRERASGD